MAKIFIVEGTASIMNVDIMERSPLGAVSVKRPFCDRVVCKGTCGYIPGKNHMCVVYVVGLLQIVATLESIFALTKRDRINAIAVQKDFMICKDWRGIW